MTFPIASARARSPLRFNVSVASLLLALLGARCRSRQQLREQEQARSDKAPSRSIFPLRVLVLRPLWYAERQMFRIAGSAFARSCCPAA